MSYRRSVLLFGFGLLTFLLAACGGDDGGAPPAASSLAAGLTLYDDFSSGAIDSATWTELVDSACTTLSAATGALVTEQTFTGATSHCGVAFPSPTAVTAFSADVTVTQYTVTAGSIRARLNGFFFNDGTLPNAGGTDRRSDIFAQIRMINFAAATGVGNVEAWIVRCTVADCSTSDTLHLETLTNAKLGETHTLYMAWDGGTVFTFQVDVLSPRAFDTTTPSNPVGPAPNAGPTNGPTRQVKTSGSVSPFGTINATFDNVRSK